LSNTLTEALMDKYTKLTRLSVINEDGDYAVEGNITGYSVAPIAVTSDEVASMARLTVAVQHFYLKTSWIRQRILKGIFLLMKTTTLLFL